MKKFIIMSLLLYVPNLVWADIDMVKIKEAYQTKDYKTAFQIWKESAENGNPVSQYNIGLMYSQGKGVKSDNTKGTIWILKSANQGFAAAQYRAGYLYSVGWGIKKDHEKAMIWYRKAASQSYTDALLELGDIYYRGKKGEQKDYAQAMIWYQKAAGKGNYYAMADIARMHGYGEGVKQDYSLAIIWYQKAEAKGYSSAPYYIKLLQEFTSYQKDAKQGDATAQFNLGKEYFKRGKYEKAIIWYKKAAEQHYIEAYHTLGKMYEKGYGVNKSNIQAQAWYLKAEKQVDAHSQNEVGITSNDQLSEIILKHHIEKKPFRIKRLQRQCGSKCECKIEYPVISDPNVSTDIKSFIAGTCEEGAETNLSVSATMIDDAYLSLTFSDYTYYYGTPHGRTYEQKKIYKKGKNGWEQITKERLFDLSKKCRDRINDLLYRQLKQQGLPRLKSPKGLLSSAKTGMSSQGIIFSYSQYELGSYAETPHPVLIPYKSLGSCLMLGK